MTDKQSKRTADVRESDSCCSKCKKDLSGCIAIFKILLGPKAKDTSHCDKSATQTVNQKLRTTKETGTAELALKNKNVSREVPEGREVQRELKNIGIVTEETDDNFDINGWLNMNRTEVTILCDML